MLLIVVSQITDIVIGKRCLDIETRNPLSEHLDLIAKRIGPRERYRILQV